MDPKACPHYDFGGGCWRADGTRNCGPPCACGCHVGEPPDIFQRPADLFGYGEGGGGGVSSGVGGGGGLIVEQGGNQHSVHERDRARSRRSS